MHLLDLTLDTPEANLALDEALLDWADARPGGAEVLRLWEAPAPLVVVGRSSRLAEEVDTQACRRRGIPVLRRVSGGAAIVAGPGCLMYAVVLSYAKRPALRLIDQAHTFVLEQLVAAIRPHVATVCLAGTSDLAMVQRKVTRERRCKFSGNSMRCKRNHFLYHGTILYDFDLSLIADCLLMPPRQPDYRRARPHDQFVANLPISVGQLRQALASNWGIAGPLTDWPRELTAELVNKKYSQTKWNRDTTG